MDDLIYGSQQTTHYPKKKLPKIITHKWKLTNKETKRQSITKDQKNEMKAKPIEFYQDKFSRIIQQLKQWPAHKSKVGLKEKPRMALE